MEIKSLEVRELQDFVLDLLKVIVREIEPFEVLRLPHYVVEDVSQASDCSHLVVVEEESGAYCMDVFLALVFRFTCSILIFTASRQGSTNVLVALKRYIVCL